MVEDYEIKKSSLIRLWATERFAQGRETKIVEEVAEGYFNELLNRSLIQVMFRKLDGSPIICHLHDLLQEILLSKLREQNIIIVASGQDVRWPEKVRRLAIHNLEDVKQRKCFRQLRSLLMFGREDSRMKAPIFLPLIDGCKLLKVLDLSFAPVDTFPDGVCKLFHLRYLSLRGTKVRAIPKSIKKLRNLETLDLEATDVAELPVEIGELHKLRYLLVGRYEGNGFKAPTNLGNLSSLQKLGTIDASGSNGNIIIGEVGKITQLKTLYIVSLRRVDGMTLCSSLAKLSNLRLLLVRSIYTGERGFLDLPSLSSCPPLLQKLRLSGRLEKVPHWIPSIQSLVKLQLAHSKLRDDQLQCLQDLPNLLQLEFFNACVGEGLSFRVGGFQRLKILKLTNLEELRWVRLEQGAMPHLEKLTFPPVN